jgi:hypothetical protein
MFSILPTQRPHGVAVDLNRRSISLHLLKNGCGLASDPNTCVFLRLHFCESPLQFIPPSARLTNRAHSGGLSAGQ